MESKKEVSEQPVKNWAEDDENDQDDAVIGSDVKVPEAAEEKKEEVEEKKVVVPKVHRERNIYGDYVVKTIDIKEQKIEVPKDEEDSDSDEDSEEEEEEEGPPVEESKQ